MPRPGRAIRLLFRRHSSRRRSVTLAFAADRLEINRTRATRRSDGLMPISAAPTAPPGMLRLTCLTAPALARLEIRDAGVAAELVSRCTRLDENLPGRHGVAAIVGWSLAAAISIVVVVLFGVPLAADRLTPLVPQAFERRLGDVADGQVKAMFGGRICNKPAGQAAFTKLVERIARSRRPRSFGPDRRYWRRRFPTPSRCPAARSICSMACWREAKIPTRSPACWRMNSAISGIATPPAT